MIYYDMFLDVHWGKKLADDDTDDDASAAADDD